MKKKILKIILIISIFVFVLITCLVLTMLILGENKNKIEKERVSIAVIKLINNNYIESERIDTYESIFNSNGLKRKINDEFSSTKINNIKLELKDQKDNEINVIYTCENNTDEECVEINNKYISLFIENIKEVYNNSEFIIVENAKIQTKKIDNQNDVLISLKNNTLTSKGATFILKNNTNNDYVYGADYYIEILKDEKWDEVNTITGNPLTFNSIAYILKANEQKEINIDWSLGYGELSNGQYRLVKKVFKDEDRPIDDSKIIKLYAEFKIK